MQHRIISCLFCVFRLQDHTEMYIWQVLFGTAVGDHGSQWRRQIVPYEHPCWVQEQVHHRRAQSQQQRERSEKISQDVVLYNAGRPPLATSECL